MNAQTCKPDLDNANVGNGYVSINTNVNLSRYIKQVYLFFMPFFRSLSGVIKNDEKEIRIMLGTCLQNVREREPLVHNITNYVTVNDVANVILASGASPIMSDEPQDVEEITAICGWLNINIGTLNVRTIEGMLKAGHKANELGHVVLLDPVGAGASSLRTNTAVKLMQELKLNVIRNGRPEMGRITGTGCQLSGLMTAYLVANPEQKLEAAAAAVGAMGLAGEIGWSYMQKGDGNSTYRNRIIDAIYNMTKEQLDEGAKYEVR